jgi:hypothetical protein
MSRYADLEKAALATKPAVASTAPDGAVNRDEKHPCPVCGWPEEPPGPEELAEEWQVLLEWYRERRKAT